MLNEQLSPQEKRYIPHHYHTEEELRKYALSIIFHVKKFKDFAIALIDYAGCNVCLQIATLYTELYHVAFENGIYIEESDTVTQYSQEEYEAWYHVFLSRSTEYQEDYFEEEYNFIKQTRPFLQYFPLFLRILALNPHLSIFNIVLIFLQRPSATVVNPARVWIDMRYEKINYMNPIITLVPYGPIQLMYDLKDVYGVANSPESIARELLIHSRKTIYLNHRDLEYVYNLLTRNMGYYGIGLEISFLATMHEGSYIIPDSPKLKIQVSKTERIELKGEYKVCISGRTELSERLYELCRQLGHYFCGHLAKNKEIVQQMSTREKEFEAESVAWIVCRRIGMEGLREDYIEAYMADGELPFFRIFQIAKAADKIEKMLAKLFYMNDTTWCKSNVEIQNTLKRSNKRNKKDKTKK